MTTDWMKLETDGLDIPRKGEVYCLIGGRKQVKVLAAEADILYQVLLTRDGREPQKPSFGSCSTARFVAEYKILTSAESAENTLVEKIKRDYA